MNATATTEAAGRWTTARPWVALVARLVLAGVFLAAGATKVGDLAGSGRAVNAYRILPFDVAMAVGAALPFIEIALGVLLLLGVATRVAAAVTGALLVVYIAGIASVWARGLSIDCGCFGTGGELAQGQSPTYGLEIARDVGLLILAGFLVVAPISRFSVDNRLLGTEDAS
ncbi:MAG TPA: MauE/DoxX family redox-associated membrane protein [Micromonosporaceae bacterium]